MTSCNQSAELTSIQGIAMTMPYKILIGVEINDREIDEINLIINATFKEIDQIFNKWNPNSELSLLNKLPANEVKEISFDLERLFEITDKVVSFSKGRFDPTVESAQQIWKPMLQRGLLPDEEEILLAQKAIGWHHISILNGQFVKDNELTQIDLGGIAKGHGIDLITERLLSAGYPNLYVEWGGEIRTTGHHPAGRPWRVFISNLGDPDPKHAIAEVDLENQAIATSGDYLQFWTVPLNAKEEITFFHIFDPKTGTPLVATKNGVASASVIAPTCAMADALATIAMLFPNFEEASQWADEVEAADPSIQIWLATE